MPELSRQRKREWTPNDKWPVFQRVLGARHDPWARSGPWRGLGADEATVSSDHQPPTSAGQLARPLARVLGTSSPCGGGSGTIRAHWRCGKQTELCQWPAEPRGKRATPLRPLQGDDRQHHPEEPSPGPARKCWWRHELQPHGRCVPQQTQARIRVFQAPQKSSTLHGGGQGRREDRQARDERGRGRRRRRKRRTRKSTESNRW